LFLLLLLGICSQAHFLAPAPTVDCVAHPDNEGCVDFHLNETFIQEMLASLCDEGAMMANIAACTVRTECVNDTNTAGSPYCQPFVLYIAACAPMMMDECVVLNQLCRNGSVVKDCQLQPLPLPKDSVIKGLVKQCCSMPMVGCEKCFDPNTGEPKKCHALQVYSDLCLQMPGMTACFTWTQFCKYIPLWDLCSYGNSKMPRMEMFFHTGIYDYILFQDWVPQTMLSYIIAIFGTLALAVVCEGLKLVRHRREIAWKHKYNEHIRKLPVDITTPITKQGEVIRRPYDFWIEIQKAVLRTLEVFFHYMLMLIAMTFNVGLFLAVVCGTGLGSLLWGPLYVMETEASVVTNEDCH